MKRRKKQTKQNNRKAGTFLLPAKKVKSYKKRENYIRQVYKLNKDRFGADKETGEVLSADKFVADIEARLDFGTSIDRAIRDYSRMDEFTNKGYDIATENIIKNLKGKKELQKFLKKELNLGRGSYKDIDWSQFEYVEDARALFYKGAKEGEERYIYFLPYEEGNPYFQGEDIIDIIRGTREQAIANEVERINEKKKRKGKRTK